MQLRILSKLCLYSKASHYIFSLAKSSISLLHSNLLIRIQITMVIDNYALCLLCACDVKLRLLKFCLDNFEECGPIVLLFR